ncbi:MAG: YscO family type III secretion system apparatus protein [Methylacidiphilaceae bacterium]|nr:YscO family type III secretion system apparatus protein [Candidatus Methylacidiphilaceae bacterium]
MKAREWEDLLRIRRLQEQAAQGRLRSARAIAEEWRLRVEEAREGLAAYQRERGRRTEALYDAILHRRLPPGELCRVYRAVAGLKEGEERHKEKLEEMENLWRGAAAAAEEARMVWQAAHREWELAQEQAQRLREEEASALLLREESEDDEEGQARAWSGHAAQPMGRVLDSRPAPGGGEERQSCGLA